MNNEKIKKKHLPLLPVMTGANASAHYYVDFDGSVWQSVEDQNIAWHCGAKKYVHPECRNANSIGIEMYVRNKGSKADISRDWYFEDATVQTAIELTKELMAKYGVPADHVIRHYDVTGKICPNPYKPHTIYLGSIQSGSGDRGKEIRLERRGRRLALLQWRYRGMCEE